jgi:Cu(I)/Ag(I) efflux system protein CusF
MKRTVVTIALSALISAGAAAMAHATTHSEQKASATKPAASAGLSEGEVRRVDKDAKKITIRHGPLENLGMPSMTMVFQVKDPAMLDQVKPGDKIKFSADKVSGAYTVTQLEAAK